MEVLHVPVDGTANRWYTKVGDKCSGSARDGSLRIPWQMEGRKTDANTATANYPDNWPENWLIYKNNYFTSKLGKLEK